MQLRWYCPEVPRTGCTKSLLCALLQKPFYGRGPHGRGVVLEKGAEVIKARGIPQPCLRQERKTKIVTFYKSDKKISTYFLLLNWRKGHIPFTPTFPQEKSRTHPHLLLQIHIPNLLPPLSGLFCCCCYF